MALLNEINVKGVPHPIVTDDGYYQEMTVGDAEQLVATTFTEDDTPYNFRTAGGAIDIGDRKQVEGIVGGTVAWNQLCYRGDFSTGWKNGYNATGLILESNVATFTASGLYAQISSSSGVTAKKGHVYLSTAVAKASEPRTAALGTSTLSYNFAPIGTEYTAIGSIRKMSGDDTQSPVLFVVSNTVNGDVISVKNGQIFDLTAMFGSTIADYIYSLEQANAGAGVAWFRKLFPKPYYAYNAGELMSVKALRHITRGFNAWDEEWELGSINLSTGENATSTDKIRSKNYISILGGVDYYFKLPNGNAYVVCYDGNKNYIGRVQKSGSSNMANKVFSVLSNSKYIRFFIESYGATYKNDISINLSWDGERDGEYEEYVKHIYELDPDLELRGIPKLSAGNDLYYDGDVYEPDGTVTRKYGIVDLSSKTWTYQSNWSSWYTDYISDMKGTDTGAETPQFICDKYDTIATNYGLTPQDFNGITSTTRGESGCRILVRNGSTTTPPTGTLVYELATPTTETADPFNKIQICDDFGTEEFIDAGVEAGDRDVAIPVGHNTKYQPNLRAKLEMAPESPEDEGYYVVYHHNGINEYVPLIIPQELPNLPTEDGTYTLKCTVASGSATLSFESEV